MRLPHLALTLVLGFGLACTGTPDEAPTTDAPAKKKGKKGKKGRKAGKGGKAKPPADDADVGRFAGLKIGAAGVGPFRVGKAPPAEVDGLVLAKRQRKEEQEGTEVTVDHLLASMDGRPIVDATLAGDGTIRELLVLRGGPQTGKGVGANAIVGSLPAVYSDARFHYSYVSDRFWIESASAGSNIQFIVDPAAFTGDRDGLGKSDLDTLELGDFEYEGKVHQIRIF